jgi:hypothetical protein
VAPPLTNTPVLAKLGFDPRTMPMKPMRSVPASVKRAFTAMMLGKTLVNKPAPAVARAEA